MKSAIYKISFLWIPGLFAMGKISAQADSITVHKEYINEVKADTFNYYQNAFVNKRSQFDISVNTVLLENYTSFESTSEETLINRHVGIGIRASYEKKLFNYHSLKVFTMYYRDSRSYDNMQLSLDYRYYFDLKKRISLALAGNSFSANYIGIRQINWVQVSPLSISDVSWSAQDKAWKMHYTKSIDYNLAFKLCYGVQREYKKHLISDFNVGLLMLPADKASNISVYIEYAIGYLF